MTCPRRIVAVAITALLLTTPARAELRLEFRDGRMTLIASEVPLNQVLAAWATVGGTEIVYLGEIGTEPITLQLENVTEKDALDTILRSRPGYIAHERRTADPGASVYDRIAVLTVTQHVPPPVPPAVNPAASRLGPRPSARPPNRSPSFALTPDDTAETAAQDTDSGPQPVESTATTLAGTQGDVSPAVRPTTGTRTPGYFPEAATPASVPSQQDPVHPEAP